MAGEKNIKVISKVAAFDAKYVNLSGKGEPRKINGEEIEMKSDGTPELVRQNSKGEPLAFFNTLNGQPVQTTGRGYFTYDESTGVKIAKNIADVVCKYYKTLTGKLIPVVEQGKTEVFEIQKFEPLSAYTDKYIIDTYLNVMPSQGKSKADHQRALTMKANVSGMKKLYDYLLKNEVVGRGILNQTSGGSLPTIAFIRAVPVTKQGDWALEFGLFKQQKRYVWVGSPNVEECVPEVKEQVVASIDEI